MPCAVHVPSTFACSHGSPLHGTNLSGTPDTVFPDPCVPATRCNCTAVVFGGLHAGAGGNDLDGNIWITSNPAVQSPIDLPHSSVAAPSFLHGVVHNFIVVGLIVEHDGDHTGLCRRSVRIGPDVCYRAVCALPKSGTKRPWNVRQNYLADAIDYRFDRIEEAMVFGRTGDRAPLAG
jgi:hypothetical protein